MMSKIATYAEVIARLFIMGLYFLFAFPMFVLFVISILSDKYFSSLFSFAADTKSYVTRLSNANKQAANERT